MGPGLAHAALTPMAASLLPEPDNDAHLRSSSRPCSPVHHHEGHAKLSSSPPRASPVRMGPSYVLKKGWQASRKAAPEGWGWKSCPDHHFCPQGQGCGLLPQHLRSLVTPLRMGEGESHFRVTLRHKEVLHAQSRVL